MESCLELKKIKYRDVLIAVVVSRTEENQISRRVDRCGIVSRTEENQISTC